MIRSAMRNMMKLEIRRRHAKRFSLGMCGAAGFSLLELVITLTVLTIMTMGVIPLVQRSIQREREQQLRESLRMMREAIKEFHRDTFGCSNVPFGNGGNNGNGGVNNSGFNGNNGGGGGGGGGVTMSDPRSRVCIDPTLFGVDNPDRYPPTLEMLKDGVDVLPRQPPTTTTFGGLKGNATEANKVPTPKKKIYLSAIPVDPMTGKADWQLRSLYDAPDATDWGNQNVFDVHSKSTATSLDGKSKYNEW